MLKVGIIGGAGIVGGELIRILIHHPQVTTIHIQSNSQAGHKISNVHKDLFYFDAEFLAELPSNVDVIFVCKAHGESAQYIHTHLSDSSACIIDMSRDFRFAAPDHDFVYGLPEWNRDKIKKANRIANPGCFATAMQLALFPLFLQELCSGDIHIQGTTGSTGAGQKLRPTTHFTWRAHNASAYKALRHQHMDEVYQLMQYTSPVNYNIHFIPMRGAFTRGIFITAYAKTTKHLDAIKAAFKQLYGNEPFVFISRHPIDVKQVVNTNYCLLQVDKQDDHLLLTAAIDNLLKGAAGQAVQNMNIRFGFPEKTALQLKSLAY